MLLLCISLHFVVVIPPNSDWSLQIGIRGADPFSLAPTSGARFLGELEHLVLLVFLVPLELLVQPRSPLTSNV